MHDRRPPLRPTPPFPAPIRLPRRGLVCGALLAALLAGCVASPIAATAPAAPTAAGATDDGGPPAFDLRSARIDLRPGEAFEIRLPGNPSTGFRWELVDPVPGTVRALGVARNEAPRGNLVGAPTQEAWRFEAAAPGSGQLSFVYRRPIDPPTVAPAQRAAFRIEVR